MRNIWTIARRDIKAYFTSPIAYVVAAVETLSGLAMLLGVFTGAAGVLIAIVMACAIYFVKFSKGFSGGWEFDLTLLLAALGVALSGSGKYSLGSYLKRHRSPQ